MIKCVPAIDYDSISKGDLIRKIMEIDDIEITPKAFHRIMMVISSMEPKEKSNGNVQRL